MNEKTNAVNQGINPEKVTMIMDSFAEICDGNDMIDVQAAILFFSAKIYKAVMKNDPIFLEEHANNFKHNFITLVTELQNEDKEEKDDKESDD